MPLAFEMKYGHIYRLRYIWCCMIFVHQYAMNEQKLAMENELIT